MRCTELSHLPDLTASKIGPDLLELLVCPKCRASLRQGPQGLQCIGCATPYEVRQGIPVLVPDDVNTEHLEVEQSLALMMKSREQLAEEQFNLRQWSLSKREFWAMVRSVATDPPKRFVNIGCGFDPSCAEFERLGHTFVNLDLVFDMLANLRRDFGATSCVNGDVNTIPLKTGAFDYVVSIDLIHHECERLPELLGSFRDLLKPKGTLFLEDPNAWGLFQMAKSIFMPRFVYRSLRSAYHTFKHSTHRPADYEFPTNVWRVMAILRELGFENIKCYPHSAYPTVSERSYRIYRSLSGFEFVRKYHNYHYMLSAVRA
jgi:SAM-dependent methyltransferase